MEITIDKKDIDLINWALLTYRHDGRCSEEEYTRTSVNFNKNIKT